MNRVLKSLARFSFVIFGLFIYFLLPRTANAAITLQDSQANAATNGGDVTVTFTASEGDVVIVYGGHPYRAGASVGPSNPGYTLANESGSTNPEFGAWYKTMGATPDTSVVGFGTGNSQDAAAYAVYVLSGVDSSILDNTSTSVGPTTGTPDNAAIGVSTTGTWVLALGGSDSNDGNVTEPTNYSNKNGDNANDTNDMTVWGATREISITGSEDPDAWSGWSTNDWYGITMAIKADPGTTFSGIIYQSDESSPYECATSGNLTVSVAIDNGSTLSGTCVLDTGAWEVTGLTVSSGETAYAYLDGGSVRGTTVLISDGTTQTDIPINQNDVILRDDVNGSITNTEISTGNTSDSDDLISFSGSDITVDPSYEFHVYTGDTYAPGANVTAGSLHVVGTYSGSTETITLNGTSGTLLTRSGTFTQGSTEVRVESASGTPDLLSAATTFHKLTITTPATVINANQAITINNSDNATLTITTGVLNDSGYGITGPGTGTGRTLTIGSGGALCLGGAATNSSATCNSNATSTTARAMPTFQTYTFDADSTVYYLSNAATSVSASPTYGNLYLNPTLTAARTYTFGSSPLLQGDFTMNPTASSTYVLTAEIADSGSLLVPSTKTTTLSGTTNGESKLSCGGTCTLTTGSLDIGAPGELDGTGLSVSLTGTSSPVFTRTGTFTAGGGLVTITQSTSDTTLTSGSITFYDLTINMLGRTGTLGNTIAVSNDLTLTAGTLADGGYQITGNATGTLSAALNGDLTLGTASTATVFPTLYSSGNISLNSASTVAYQAGVAQTVSEVPTYGNLDLVPDITGNVTYTFGGVTGVNGDFTINPNSLGVDILTVNMAGAITVAATGTTTITRSGSALSTLDTQSGSNYALNSGFLNIATGGTLIANNSDITLSGTSGTIFTRVGTFTKGASTVIFSQSTGGTTLTSGTVDFHHLEVDMSGQTGAVGNNIDVGGDLTVTAGVLSIPSTYTLSVTGNTDITGELSMASSGNQTFTGTTTINSGGTLTRSSASGTNTFVGFLTISGGGTFTTSNNPAFTLRGGLSNSGTFTSGTGTYTFDTNPQTISGNAATSFGGNVAISGAITLQNSNADTVTVSGNMTGSVAGSTYQNNANATTDFDGAVLTTGTLTASASPNTITYTGSSAQTVKSATYHHLEVKPSANSITSSFGSGTLTVNGNLDLGNGTNTGVVIEATTNDPDISVTGNVTVNANTTMTNSDDTGATLNIDGDFTITGIFTAPAGTANDSFTLAGNFNKTGTYNSNSGQITLDTTGTSELNYNSNTSFYQFSVLSASGGKNVKFDEAYDTIITNDITIQGSNCTGGRIFLDSTVNDNVWELNINTGASQSISYVDLEDADATISDETPVAQNSTETDSNTAWTVNAGDCGPPAPPGESNPKVSGNTVIKSDVIMR